MTQPVRKSEYQLNVPLLVATVVVVAIVGAAAYFWHSRQLGNLANSLFDRANQYTAEEKYADAAQYLFRYVQLRPQDVEGRVQLAEAFDKTAKDGRSKMRSIGYFRYAVGLATERLDLQQRLAELLLETGQFGEAKKQAEAIKKANPKNLSAQQILALAAYAEADVKVGGADWTPIKETVKAAVDINPADLKLAQCAAEICRVKLKGQDPHEADKVMDQMVQANRKSAPSLLVRWRYRQRFGLSGADEDLDEALQTAPNDPDALLAAGDRAVRKQKWDEAQKYLEDFVKTSPKDSRGYIGLAQVQIAQGQPAIAIETYRQGLAQVGGVNLGLNWKLAELLVSQRDFKNADAELTNIESAIKKNASQWTADARTSALAETQFLRALWWVGQGKPMRGVEILEKLASQNVSGVEGQRFGTSPMQAQFMLANLFASMGQWEQAAAAYSKVLVASPTATAARFGTAKANLMTGQIETAARHFDILRSEGVSSPEIDLLAAQTQLQTQLPRPAEERNWKSLEQILAAKLQQEKPSWEWLLLQCDYDLATDQKDHAVETLQSAEQKFAENENCLRAIALCYERLDQLAEADRIYAKWQALAADSPTLLTAQAASLVRRGKADDAIAMLKAGEASLPESSRPAVRHQLVEIQIRQGQLDAARKALAELSESNPENLPWSIELAELCLKNDGAAIVEDLATAEKCEQRLQTIEGDRGVWWKYFRARRLLLPNAANENARLKESQTLASEVEAARPQWTQAHLLKAMIAEKQKDIDGAIAEYRQAIDVGGQNLAVAEHLIVLLYQTQQFDEAATLLGRLQDNQRSAQLSNLAIALSLRKDEFDQAIGMARAAVKKSPQDARAHLRLAQTMLLGHEKVPSEAELAQAEAELKKAAELAPQDPIVWASLFTFYLRNQKVPETREILQQIEKQESLPTEAQAMLLAQGYEATKDSAEAEKWYARAVAVAKDKSAAEQRQASYWVRAKSGKATEALRTLEKAAATARERRQLALDYFQLGDPKSLDKALGLLSDKQADPAEAAANDRLKSEVLLKRNAPGDRDEVVKLLTALTGNSKSVIPRDRLLLAGLLEMNGNTAAARQQYELLVASPKADISHWGAFADYLLRHNSPSEAATWVRRLEDKDPKSFTTISLRARLLQKEGRLDIVEGIVEPTITELLAKQKTNPGKSQVELLAGQLYMQGDQFEAALRHFRQAYQLNSDAYAPLATALVQAKQTKEAADVCLAVIKDKATTQPATILAAALVGTKASAEAIKETEPVFTAALAADPGNVDVLVALSGLRFIQGQYQEVARLSRQVLEKDAKHVLAMNNLASILAEDPAKRSEAIEVIDRAIQVGGRLATLLDTKAIALLYEGQTKEALALLKEAIKEAPNDPRYLFHLALAHQKLGDVRQARETLLRAQQAKLLSALLTPYEQKLLEELSRFVATGQQSSSPLTSDKI